MSLLACELPVTAIEPRGSDRWRFYFANAADQDRAARQLRAHPNVRVESLEVADENWTTRSQAFLTAVTIGDLVIAPPWDIPPASGGHVIVIEPSMGFGTGHHQSTRLCLQALQEIFRPEPEATRSSSGVASAPDVASAFRDVASAFRRKAGGRLSVLDVGTGSGVLAITASLLGAADVTGIDVDQDAVESARRNVTLNPGARVQFACVGVEAFAGPARDIVLANLIMELLRQHAARLDALVKEGGLLVASGFTAEQEPAVLSAFSTRPAPFRALGRFVEGDWITLVLQRLAEAVR